MKTHDPLTYIHDWDENKDPLGNMRLDSYSNSILPLAKTKTIPKQWLITKSGEKGIGCNEWIPLFCKDCGHIEAIKHHCMKRECPHCGKRWAWREGRKAAFRIWFGKHKIHGKKGRIMHFVYSIDPKIDVETIGPDQEKQYRKDLYKYLKKVGISGGAIVNHPYRLDENKKYTRNGFHFHIVGIVPKGVDLDIDLLNDSDVFKVIKDAKYKDYRGFRNYKSIVRLMAYELGHCGVLKGRHALTYFGDVSYNKLKNEDLENIDPELWADITKPLNCCSNCGSTNVISTLDLIQDIGFLASWADKEAVPYIKK